MSITAQMRKWSIQKGQEALLGTWAKIGKSHYQRVTGEQVKKTAQGWSTFNGWVYQSRAAAFSAIDHKHKGA